MAPEHERRHQRDGGDDWTRGPERDGTHGREQRRGEGGQRGIPRDGGDREPGCDERESEHRRETAQHPDQGRDTFAALEPEEHGIEVAGERTEARGSHRTRTESEHRRGDDRQRALRDVADERQQRGRLAVQAQYVRRTRVIRARAARIAVTEHAAHEYGRGDRAAAIACEQHDERHGAYWIRWPGCVQVRTIVGDNIAAAVLLRGASHTRDHFYMDIVYLHGLRLETLIGVWAFERQMKQQLVVDIDMGKDITAAAESDDVADTIDYKRVADRMADVARESSFALVEALGERMACVLLEEFALDWVRIRINKQGALREARDVGVILERGRRP